MGLVIKKRTASDFEDSKLQKTNFLEIQSF